MPTILGLMKDHISYQGFIFVGLMNKAGDPYVIEYNVRMGDPETQAVLPRIKSDFLELLMSIGTKTLGQYTLGVATSTATTVVMVAKGYPEAYEKGHTIEGLNVAATDTSLVFHAGTMPGESGAVLTAGGRVLGITGLGDEIPGAISNAYACVEKISWEGAHYRKDIGQDILLLQK
jgi:phosphoribosylamine--glycine ligase